MKQTIFTINESEVFTLPGSIPRDENHKNDSPIIHTTEIDLLRSSEKIKEQTGQNHLIGPNKVSYWNAGHLILVLSVCILCMALLIILPRHNLVFYPSYWYETAIMYVFVIALVWTIDQAISCAIYTNSVPHLYPRKVLVFNVIVLTTFIVTYACSHLIWVYYLQFNPPVPLLFQVWSLSTTWIASFAGIWCMYPSEMKTRPENKRKLGYFFLYSTWFNLILRTIQAECLRKFYVWIVPEHLEWTMAIVIPTCKELNNRIVSNLVAKMGHNKREAGKVLFGSSLSAYFTIFISERLASASSITVNCVLFVKLFMHIIMTIRVIHLSKRIGCDRAQVKNQQQKIKSYVLNIIVGQTIGAIIPILYATGVEMVYHGPNKSLFADGFTSNLHLEQEEHHEHEEYLEDDNIPHEDDNVSHLFDVMLQMIGVDLVSIVVCCILLWMFAKINLFYQFCYLMRQYWFILMVKVLSEIIIHFACNDINMGSNWGEMEWITDEGRFTMIRNSTYLTNSEKNELLNIS